LAEPENAVVDDRARPRVQLQVNAHLRRGVLFSILWLMGIGSAIALVNGLAARRLIAESRGKLQGSGGAWWCIIVGAIGLCIWVPVIVLGLIGATR
jgi:hypothetical protein